MDQAKLFLSSFGGAPDPIDPGDPIGNSLRFRNDGNTMTHYLSSPAHVGNIPVYTMSWWVKNPRAPYSEQSSTMIADTGAAGSLIQFYPDRDNSDNTNGQLYTQNASQGGFPAPGICCRDHSAWYHFVMYRNNDEGGVYMNGKKVHTGFVEFNNSTETRIVGYGTTNALSGYMAEIYRAEGQVLPPTTFGRFNSNGVWVPVKPEGLT